MADLKDLIDRTFKPVEEQKRPVEQEYPSEARFSPHPRKLYEFEGRIVNQKGKRKLVLKEPKPYQPLRKDTASGRGEKRKRYI
jgi:hypothetical protein